MQQGGVRVIKVQDAGYVQNSPMATNTNTPITNTPITNTPIANPPIANTPIVNAPIANVEPYTHSEGSTDSDEQTTDVESSIDDYNSSHGEGETTSTDGDGETTSTDVESTDGESEPMQGGAKEDDTSSISTADILSKDPLFLVLSEFLMDDEGTNIVTMLGRINKNLKSIKSLLEGQVHTEKKRKSKKH